MVNLTIRQEQPGDYEQTENVIVSAFTNMDHSDKDEHKLVSRIRNSNAFIPELSLVAIDENNEILGHILLSKIEIINDYQTTESLALAPVSVLPKYQNKGIGKTLILKSLKMAKKLGYQSVIVLGHPEYYPKFGFKKASFWGIKSPFEVPDEAFMAIELQGNSLKQVSGNVKYPSLFYDQHADV